MQKWFFFDHFLLIAQSLLLSEQMVGLSQNILDLGLPLSAVNRVPFLGTQGKEGYVQLKGWCSCLKKRENTWNKYIFQGFRS